MTLKRSFWDKCKENNKRRIWVWAVSILAQLIMYPGITLIYMSRIHSRGMSGEYYGSIGDYQRMLKSTAAEALGFHTNARVVVMLLILAALIALQGFGWLHDRQKLDLYRSVPVREKDRFAVIYFNSVMIWLLPYLASQLLGLLTAGLYGAVSGTVLISCAASLIANLFYFLFNLNLFILAIALTGNRILACLGFAFLSVLGEWLYQVIKTLQQTMFDTVCYAFSSSRVPLSIFFEYAESTYNWEEQLKYQRPGFITDITPVLVRWAVCAAAIGILAYLCYRKRPAESAGKAIAYPVVWPFIKVMIVVSGALFTANAVYEWSENSAVIAFFGLVGSAALFSCILEVICELDIRAAARHPVSSGFALSLALVIFCIFWFDVFGYDNYIPERDRVESTAVILGDYSQDYWKYVREPAADAEPGYNVWNGKISMTPYGSVSPHEYAENNMFLTDTDAVVALAQKGIALNGQKSRTDASNIVSVEEKRSFRYVNVLYRLNNGRRVTRSYEIDMRDPEIAGILDAIIGSKEYRDGFYMPAATPECLTDDNMRLYYTNGSVQTEIAPSDAEELYRAWDHDMEKYDYSYASTHDMCGEIRINALGTIRLPVYDSFTDTIEFLSDRGAYYPLYPDVDDIESLTVTNYNYAEEDSGDSVAYSTYKARNVTAVYEDRTVTEVYEDPEQIRQIMETVYPDTLSQQWRQTDPDDPSYGYMDANYTITIAFKQDMDYPYKKVPDSFSIRHGQVPDFVAEDTAYEE